jgi:3-hydroxyisobutyrate dehydrogenase-like beta-hydroxyacid dehydrogenase
MISETFADGFQLRLMAKKGTLPPDMAHALGIATPTADLCAELWEAAEGRITRRCGGVWKGLGG